MMLGTRLNMPIKKPAERGIVMTKDEFLDQFAQLNTEIESALAMQDFDRARLIDGARRRMLKNLQPPASWMVINRSSNL